MDDDDDAIGAPIPDFDDPEPDEDSGWDDWGLG